MQKTRALVQATLAAAADSEQGNKNLRESWQDYVDEMFPFQRGQRKRDDQAAIDYLKKMAAEGPLTVKPLQTLNKPKSKLKKQYIKRTQDESTTVSRMRIRQDKRRHSPR
jgi:hypothetical protein